MKSIPTTLFLGVVALVTLPAVDARADSPSAMDRNADGFVDETAPASDVPTGTPTRGAGTILIDLAHGETSDSANLIKVLIEAQGWTVTLHPSGPITPALLEAYDAFLIPTAVAYGYPTPGPGIAPFSPAEVAAVGSFYASGRGVWIFSEYLQNPAGVNSVSSQFGVTFNGDIIFDPDAGDPIWPLITDIVPHPITEGVTSYTYLAGCSLNGSPPATILATADENAYSTAYPAGTFPPVLAVAENAAGGCAVFQGDITFVPPTMVANILDCLAFDGPVSIGTGSWGSVKASYR